MSSQVELGDRRILQPGKLRWLRALGWGVALALLVALAFALVSGLVYAGVALASGIPAARMMDEISGPGHLAAMTLGALASIAAYGAAVRMAEDRPLPELALRPALPETLAGLAIGAVMMAVTVGIMVAAGWATIEPARLSSAWRAVAMAIQSGVVEEILFRLVVLRLLWRAFGIWPALAISAFLFGALHIMNPNANWFAALCIMVEAGIMLGAFYILTGRIWVSIGVHAGWNFTQGWFFGAAVSGTDFFEGGPLDLEPVEGVPAYLSGGGFGPESSLAGLLIGTAVGALTLWLAWKRGSLDGRGTVAAPAQETGAREE